MKGYSYGRAGGLFGNYISHVYFPAARNEATGYTHSKTFLERIIKEGTAGHAWVRLGSWGWNGDIGIAFLVESEEQMLYFIT